MIAPPRFPVHMELNPFASKSQGMVQDLQVIIITNVLFIMNSKYTCKLLVRCTRHRQFACMFKKVQGNLLMLLHVKNNLSRLSYLPSHDRTFRFLIVWHYVFLEFDELEPSGCHPFFFWFVLQSDHLPKDARIC